MLNIMMGGSRRQTRLSKYPALLVAFFTLYYYSQVDASRSGVGYKCPKQCKCDEKSGLISVECLQGNMQRLPVNEVDLNVSTLLVSAPENSPNYLTIGPVLTQPSLFKKLRIIKFTYSNIPSIGKNAFWGLVNLKTLNLTHNNITSIEQDNFRGLINLEEIDLSFNHIDKMASDTYIYCKGLKRLYLSNNNITLLNSRLFRMLGQLQELDLSGNPMVDLNPDVFKDIQQLIILKCRDCLLSRINAQLYNLLSNLREMDLSKNQIKYILKDDFQDLKRLEIINLEGNKISVIVDNVFGKNKQLRELNLANNKLALLSSHALTNLTLLYYLNIGNNKIERFHPQTFVPVVKSLSALILSGNNLPLSEIIPVMQLIPGLQDVRLANLSLTDIQPDFFPDAKHLKNLDISWNNITQFPLKLLSKAENLHKLDISHNHLTKLEDADLQRLEKIPYVILSRNKWNCNQCSTGIMLDYMRFSVLNNALRNLRCNTPVHLSGVQMKYLKKETLEECLEPHEAQVSVLAIILVVMAALIATVSGKLCCTLCRAQRYYTNEEKRGEQDPEHPEELLPHTDLGALASTNAPFSDLGNNS